MLTEKWIYLYDGLGRLTEETENQGSTETWSKAYAYDKASNRKTITVTGGESYTTTYEYDLNNRLKSESKLSAFTEDVLKYKYDKNGNQISKMSYSQSSLSSDSPQLGIYVVGEVKPAVIGNITSEIYEYDVFNQLVQVKNDNGTSVYAYKPDGLRAGTTKKGVMGSTGSEDVTTAYIWDGSNIIAETTGNEITTYIRGINLIAANKNGAKNYYLYNAHGDVVQMANASGTLIKSYQYDSFGVEIDPDPNDTNVWRYAGEMFDKETGNYYLRARYYNPTTGRFTTEDPIRDELNWYTYCGNNPVNFIDSFGLAAVAIRDFIEEYIGYGIRGSVGWNGSTRTATFSLMNTTLTTKSTGVNSHGLTITNVDGRMTAEETDLIRFLGAAVIAHTLGSNIVSRGDWGAVDKYDKWELDNIKTDIVIHHTANNSTIKSIDDDHNGGFLGLGIMAQKFDGIGYHFVIAADGTIYEGRPLDLKGAHVGGANTGKIGVSL